MAFKSFYDDTNDCNVFGTEHEINCVLRIKHLRFNFSDKEFTTRH